MSDGHLDKEIKYEFEIRVTENNVLSLYRFPNKINGQIQEVSYKPKSKYKTIKMMIPNKNTSALKIKQLGTNSMNFKANSIASNFYNVNLEGNCLILNRISDQFIFQPEFNYYPFEYQSISVKKAENREEYEHRMKNINYKLKNIQLEENKQLVFENCQGHATLEGCVPFENKDITFREYSKDELNLKTTSSDNLQVPLLSRFQTGSIEKQSRFTHGVIKEGITPEMSKRIQNTIKLARIVNLKDLVKIYHNKEAILNILLSMTEIIHGRAILKTSFYESCLHDIRNKILCLFIENQYITADERRMAGKEVWLVDEISTLNNGRYILKGCSESELSVVKGSLSQRILNLFSINRVMTWMDINNKIGVPEDILKSILHEYSIKNKLFHLCNDSYALNDDSYWFNRFFQMCVNKRSFDPEEVKEVLNEQEHTIQEIIEELKLFCHIRANKYYLKLSK